MEHKNLCLSIGSKMATDVSDAIDELPVTGNLKVYMGVVCGVSLLTTIKRVVGQARYDALIEMIESEINLHLDVAQETARTMEQAARDE